MNTKIFTALTALAVIIPLSALANSYDEKKDSYSPSFFNNDILKDTYVSIGYGKSLPQGKLKLLSFNDNNDEIFIKEKNKNKDIFKTSLGKKINNIRIELEFLYSKKHAFNSVNNYFPNQTLSQNITTSHYTYLINTLYDFKNFHNNLKPYIGLGIGISRNKVASTPLILNTDSLPSTIFANNTKKSSTSFAWNTSLGVIVDVNEHVFLDFSYKYMDLGKAKGTPLIDAGGITTDNNNIKGRFRNNVFLVSAGFKF
ncbi:heat resistant agglutinin 1 [endosymbiont of Acanthamoeba sp. UWC8]|uniref:outer membrane protein n=1 Tax=endosymbiont of Acanthamoeba sp. UWC8 TaxID=86106 RepID=UPI0004D17ADF|nr:outer membrane beta-barrel protein [endosymbiont of Acanthamoeba sp. UWC8]AIF80790.1 heat resistant agglutinin 1 [endosymbiont of Acanthamoeba sp. UWC8]